MMLGYHLLADLGCNSETFWIVLGVIIIIGWLSNVGKGGRGGGIDITYYRDGGDDGGDDP